MKKLLALILILAATSVNAQTLTYPNRGGTGTSTAPSYGQLLVGNANGTYSLMATSSLGIVGTGGGGTWGSITGTLADQTDLLAALNAKFSLASWYSTTTDQLTEGLTNLYFTPTRVNTVLNSSTTIASAASAPLSLSNHLLTIALAGLSTDGYLSSTQFNVFNNKIASSSLSGSNPITYNPATGVIACPTCGTGTGNISGSGTEGGLAMFNGMGSIESVATGTVSSGAGISVTAGQKIIGTGLTITNTGVTSLAGTAGQISSTGATGDLTISIPQTSPISLPYASTTFQTVADLLSSSSTLQNFTAFRSTTTHATSTSLYSPTVTATTICLTADNCRTTWPAGGGGEVTGTGVANRVTFWDGVSSISSNANFLYDGTTLQVPALLLTGSTTLQSVTAVSATTTNLAVTGSSTIPLLNNYRLNGVYASTTALTTTLLDSTGTLNIKSGGDGLNINITASNGTSADSGGGRVNFRSGNGAATNGDGGLLQFLAGTAAGSGEGGDIYIASGPAATGGSGGDVYLSSGAGGSAGGDGGQVEIVAESALGGNANGGDVTLYFGAKSGSGRDGRVQFAKDGTSLLSIFDFSNVATSNKTFTWPNMTGSVVVSSTTAASSLIPYASTTVLSADTSYLGTAQASTLLLTGSTTLQNFTGLQGTTTNLAIRNTPSTILKTNAQGSVIPAISGTDYQAAGSYITALTGDVSATGPGSVAATIGPNAVTFSKFQQMQANTIMGNPTGATADAQGIATSSLGLRQADIIGLKTTDTPSFTGIALTGSSTFQNFTAVNSTTTNATSTTLAASSSVCIAGDCRSAWPFTGTYPFTPTNNYGVDTSGTSTPISAFAGINASSTSRFDLVVINQATTTNFASNTICLSGDCRNTWPSGTGSGVSDWQKETTYNTLSLTPTTTIPLWSKAAIYASSTLTVDGQIMATSGLVSVPAYSFAVAPTSGIYANVNGSVLIAVNGTNIASAQSGGFGINSSTFLNVGNPGSAAQPSLYFGSDSTTGYFKPTTDTLGFSTKGSERMRVLANGSIGIGTSTPAWNLQIATSTGGRIALTDTGAAANFKHWVLSSQGGVFTVASSTDNYATSTVPALMINALGNVGIGTSSPIFGSNTYKLAVTGDTLIHGNLVLKPSAGISPVDSGAVGAGLAIDGVASLTGQNQAANTTSLTFGTRKLTTGNAFLFQYRNAGGATFDGLSLQNITGNLGIGTSTPISTLAVQGVQASTTIIDSSAGVNLKNWGLVSKTGGFLISTSTDMGVLSSNPAVAISSNGYFGIATSSPFRALSVAGDAIFQGGAAATSTMYVTSSSASKGGRIVLKDVNGSTCTEITTLAGVMTAKAVTCP